MLDGLTSGVIGFLIGVIELLPESPIQSTLAGMDLDAISGWIGFVNWFLPFDRMAQITRIWLVGVAAYYVYQIIFRWLKVIG